MRSGVGFYGKNTMVITRRHGSWVVLGTLVTTAELEPTPPLDPGCGSCTLCIDACPTGALDEPGVLDATRCLSYWTQVPEPIPEPYRARARRAGLRLRHLPGRLPVEPRRRAAARGARARRGAHVDLVAWLEADARELRRELDRLYVPRNDARWLRRNALVALGNVGEDEPRTRGALERYADGRGRAARRARPLGARAAGGAVRLSVSGDERCSAAGTSSSELRAPASRAARRVRRGRRARPAHAARGDHRLGADAPAARRRALAGAARRSFSG